MSVRPDTFAGDRDDACPLSAQRRSSLHIHMDRFKHSTFIVVSLNSQSNNFTLCSEKQREKNVREIIFTPQFDLSSSNFPAGHFYILSIAITILPSTYNSLPASNNNLALSQSVLKTLYILSAFLNRFVSITWWLVGNFSCIRYEKVIMH